MRATAALGLLLGVVAALPGAHPLPPTTVTRDTTGSVGEVAADLSKQSGIPVSVDDAIARQPLSLRFKGAAFWEALDATATAAKARVALTDGGRKVRLVPKGKSREASAASGAFRVVAQQVVGRALLEQGVTVHEVQLLVHWEPRIRVYRIDTAPKVSKVVDVPGSKIVAAGGGAQVLPLDATSEMRVQLTGLTRDSDRITALSGVFNVTGAEKMLTFEFAAPGGKLPAGQTKERVTAALKRVQKKDDTWEVEVEVTYPENQPTFESFQGEWWLRDNRMVLRAPGGRTFPIPDYEVPMPDSPRPLRVVHRFKEDAAKGLGDPTAKGWSIVYETPSPLADVKVPFELRDIPLP